MGKRKDAKGRVLKQGEGQRPNGTYEYRYTDRSGKRQRVYAKTLDDLRQKEVNIHRDVLDGIDSAAGEMTVVALVNRYMGLRRDLKENTLRAYNTEVNRLNALPFGQKTVKAIKKSDAIAFLLSLHDSGLKQNTVSVAHNILRPAFEMAVDDDMIRKNPFKFKLSDIVPNDANKRTALTKSQQEKYLQFVRDYGHDNYYDDIVILLGTGLRVSELYGLTRSDIDFERRCIHVERQLCRTADKPYFITSPKTKSGIRDIPMTDTVYLTLRRVISNRPVPKVEMLIDGHSGFLFLDKLGKPKVAMHLENYMRGMQRKFNKLYGSSSMPNVTPHVLRHTFCSNMAKAGIDAKSLQTVMGHSNISVTYDVYTHVDYETVERAFFKAAASV